MPRQKPYHLRIPSLGKITPPPALGKKNGNGNGHRAKSNGNGKTSKSNSKKRRNRRTVQKASAIQAHDISKAILQKTRTSELMNIARRNTNQYIRLAALSELARRKERGITKMFARVLRTDQDLRAQMIAAGALGKTEGPLAQHALSQSTARRKSRGRPQ